MGCFLKLIDSFLFLYFLFMSIVIPSLDAQTCIPQSFFPDKLVQLSAWYAREYGDYLVAEKPHFFVGLVWMELAFQWPLCLANLFGILGSKSWFPKTCLMYGVSVATSMAVILAELMWSLKASDDLKMVYAPFLGFGVLAMLRGLLPCRSRTASTISGTRPVIARKKRA